MLMPEASMHEDDLAAALEDNVRFPREALVVQPVPVPAAVEQLPHLFLGRAVFRANAPHVLTAALRGKLIRHQAGFHDVQLRPAQPHSEACER